MTQDALHQASLESSLGSSALPRSAPDRICEIRPKRLRFFVEASTAEEHALHDDVVTVFTPAGLN
jgi:hypothetical protein